MTITQQLESCLSLSEAKKLLNYGNNMRPSGATRRQWIKIMRRRFNYPWPQKEARRLKTLAVAKGRGVQERKSRPK